jgi:hypothetical protein
MTTTSSRALRGVTAVLVALGMTALAGPAEARKPDLVERDPIELTLDAGLACEFPVHLSGTGLRTAITTDGNVTTVTGFGYELTLTNLTDPRKTYSTNSNRFTEVTTRLPNGSVYVETRGKTLQILFPTDVPAGPSTTLYTGKLTYTTTPDGITTLLSHHGHAEDVCAALR